MRFFAKTVLDDADLYLQFGKDAEQNPTGRVDYVGTTHEATGFAELADLAEALEYHHIAGVNIVQAP